MGDSDREAVIADGESKLGSDRCFRCGGKGYVYAPIGARDVCGRCNGSGRMTEEQRKDLIARAVTNHMRKGLKNFTGKTRKPG